MKKTIIININGIIFNIDEDAYDNLQRYLDELKRYFVTMPEGKEIIEDIEARIAELMQPKISETRQSINVDDILEIIGILGEPQDIAGTSEENYQQQDKTTETKTSRKINRRFYRDPDHAILGGVCSGIAAYFDIDPVIVRIIFMIFSFAGFISFIIYPILWIAIPQANTAAQKLEMRGESVTILNLERTLRDEYQQVKQNIQRIDSNSIGSKIHTFVHEVVRVFGTIVYALWNVLRFLFGTFMIFMAVVLIIALISTVYFNTFFIHDHFLHNFSSLKEYAHYIISPFMADFLLILAFILILLPLSGLIYGGLKMMIRFQAKDKWVLVTLSIIWVICIFIFASVVLSEVDTFKKEEKVKELIALTPVKQHMLYVNLNYSPDIDKEFQESNNDGMFNIIGKGNNKQLIGKIRLDIERTSNSSAELEIVRSGRGNTSEEAASAAKTLKVSFAQNDTLLNLDPVFRVMSGNSWKFQTVHLVLKLPVGMKLYLNENTRNSLSNAENVEGRWAGDLVAQTLLMTDRGLEFINFSSTIEKTIDLPEKKIINIQLREHFQVTKNDWERLRDRRQYGIVFDDSKKMNYGIINFDIRKSEDTKAKIEIIRTASGSSNEDASASNARVVYTWEQKDSVIWLDPIFRFPQDKKPNEQHVKVILRLPIHSCIFLSKDLEFFTRDIQGLNADYNGDKRVWEMTNDGISEKIGEKDSE